MQLDKVFWNKTCTAAKVTALAGLVFCGLMVAVVVVSSGVIMALVWLFGVGFDSAPAIAVGLCVAVFLVMTFYTTFKEADGKDCKVTWK